MAHWHDYNPWARSVLYLPDLNELSACLNPIHPNDSFCRWERDHPNGRLDAYLLKDGPNATVREIHCGIRFGAAAHEYYSPPINQFVANLLHNKYERNPMLNIQAASAFDFNKKLQSQIRKGRFESLFGMGFRLWKQEVKMTNTYGREDDIVVVHVYPPIPSRDHDWCAYREGREENGNYGWGRTPDAAIADLQQNEERS